MSNKWDRHFLALALQHAKMSKDPRTKVGAVIVGQDRELISAGFNGFPRNIIDKETRLNNRDLKLKLMVHAEMNAVLAAAKVGISLERTSLYLAATDSSGSIWGGPPCTRCTVEILQTGIRHIISFPQKLAPSRWQDDLTLARDLLAEAGVAYAEIPLED